MTEQDKINDLERQLQETKTALEKKTSDYARVQRQLDTAHRDLENIAPVINERHDAITSRDWWRDEYRKLYNSLDDLCDAGGDTSPVANLKNIRDERDQLRQQFSETVEAKDLLLAGLRDSVDEANRRVAERDAEILRLRGELKLYKDTAEARMLHISPNFQHTQEIEAERDQLRQQLALLAEDNAEKTADFSAAIEERDKALGRLAERDAEIERLKGELSNAKTYGEIYRASEARVTAENDDLQSSLDKMTEALGAISKKAKEAPHNNPHVDAGLLQECEDIADAAILAMNTDMLQKENDLGPINLNNETPDKLSASDRAWAVIRGLRCGDAFRASGSKKSIVAPVLPISETDEAIVDDLVRRAMGKQETQSKPFKKMPKEEAKEFLNKGPFPESSLMATSEMPDNATEEKAGVNLDKHHPQCMDVNCKGCAP